MSFFQKLFDQPLMKSTGLFGSTIFERKQFFPVWNPVIVEGEYLVFIEYPFEPSLAFQDKFVSISSIQNIDLNHGPPTLLVNNELIGFPVSQKEELIQISFEYNIPVNSRPYIWNSILEPFLDQEFSEEENHRTYQFLSNYGLSREEVDAWRHLVGTQMMKYNFDTMLWDWTDLNIFDMLAAMRPKYNQTQFKMLYEIAMEIALLSPIEPE
ncbi:MAG: hypothetical protein IPI60_04495 [Saprospiraceae bacterium]|nr:hypothetical protein [Saprospiraceae bacterium]